MLKQIRWGDGSSTKPAVDISKNIELTQFRYKEHKLIERQFHLSTGILKIRFRNILEIKNQRF